jgi:hypothetical protein
MRAKIAATMVGLLSAACQPAEQARYPSAPGPAAYTSNYANAGQACADYGFAPGTPAYETCVSRERAARATGRVDRDYAEAHLTSDAQNACASYGLPANSPRYQNCVTREVDARRYQGTNQARPAHRLDPYGNRFDSQGYRDDAYGNRLAGQG